MCKHQTLDKAVKILEDGTIGLLGDFRRNFVDKDAKWIPNRLVLGAARRFPGKR